MIGYRGWVAYEDGRLLSLWAWAEWPRHGWAAATCGKHSAPPPVADCTCGLNVVRDLGEMLAYAQQSSARWSALPYVIGAVEFDGPTAPGAMRTDPPSTVRVRRASLVEIVALSPSAEALRPVLREMWGVPIVDGASEAPQRMATGGRRDEGAVFELSRLVVSCVLDPRRFRADPVNAIAAVNVAQELLGRAGAVRPHEVPAMCQELRNFLSVIGG